MMTSRGAFARVAMAATSMASTELASHNGVNSADYVTSSGSRTRCVYVGGRHQRVTLKWTPPSPLPLANWRGERRQKPEGSPGFESSRVSQRERMRKLRAIGEGMANEVTVERGRIGSAGRSAGRPDAYTYVQPSLSTWARGRQATGRGSGARPGRWQDEGSLRLHPGTPTGAPDLTVEKFRRCDAPITSHCSRDRRLFWFSRRRWISTSTPARSVRTLICNLSHEKIYLILQSPYRFPGSHFADCARYFLQASFQKI